MKVVVPELTAQKYDRISLQVKVCIKRRNSLKLGCNRKDDGAKGRRKRRVKAWN